MAKQNEITFGDLVKVGGYGDTPFFVDSWQEIRVHEPEGTYDEIVYDVTNAFTGEYEIVFVEDITRICGAEAADEYLKTHAQPPKINSGDLTINISEYLSEEVREMLWGESNKRKPERQPTARELSAQEADRRKKARKERAVKIDALLDEYGDYRRLADEFGDEEYKARVEYIGVKLAEVSSEGRR